MHHDKHDQDIKPKSSQCVLAMSQEELGHPMTHVHGLSCGHEVKHHEDHKDFVVDGMLHCMHNDHCDTHGKSDSELLRA